MEESVYQQDHQKSVDPRANHPFEKDNLCRPRVSKQANHYYGQDCNRPAHDRAQYELSLSRQNHRQINLPKKVIQFGYKMDDDTQSPPFDHPAQS